MGDFLFLRGHFLTLTREEKLIPNEIRSLGKRSLLMPQLVERQAPIPPPADHRAQAKRGPTLHSDAFGAPCTSSDASLLLIALLRTLWRLSPQEMRNWGREWPALALACGLPLGNDGCPRTPSPSQQCTHRQRAAAPLPEALVVLSMLAAIRSRLSGARDLMIDSAPILAWRHADLDAASWGLKLIARIPASLGAAAVIPWNPTRQKHRSCLPPTWTKEERGTRSGIERFFGRVFLFFHLQRPPLAGWSTIARQAALTDTATIIVAFAAQQAGRPDLICSPTRV